MFESVKDVTAQLDGQGYVASHRIATVVYLAQMLEKPVLVEGPAGVGKTELAKVVASSLGREMIRLQCYEGLDEAKALYEWEYSKQLLYTQILKEPILRKPCRARRRCSRSCRARREGGHAFSFPTTSSCRGRSCSAITLGTADAPAHRRGRQVGSRIRGVSARSPLRLPGDGAGAWHHSRPRLRAAVSSHLEQSAREMSDALKRRCLHLFIDYPSEELEVQDPRPPRCRTRVAKLTPRRGACE